MNDSIKNDVSLDDYLGCMGEFNMSNIICKKFCCINLKCIIEHNKSIQTELMEELFSAPDEYIRLQ